MSGSSFQIALPTLDDDLDDTDELFSYPAPRFGQSSPSPFGSFGGAHGSGGGETFGGSNGFSSSNHLGGGHPDPSMSTRKESYASAQLTSSSSRNTGANRNHSNSVGSDSLPPPPPIKQIIKKSSFGALRSTFGGGKKDLSALASQGMHKTASASGLGAPPLPDQASPSNYPVLRNPFSRSASSNATFPTTNNTLHSPPPSLFTSGSNNKTRKARNGSSGPSTSSITYHQSRPSNTSSGFSTTYSPNSTPSPSLPSARRLPHQRTPSTLSITTNSFSSPAQIGLPPPSTPPQFALHLLLRLFQEVTEGHLDSLVNANRWPLSRPMPLLEDILGKGKDKALDKVLDSLGMAVVAGGNGNGGVGRGGAVGGRAGGAAGGAWGGGDAKVALDCLVKWRNGVMEDEVGRKAVRSHLPCLSTPGVADAAAMLNERISCATMYILLRALLSIVQHSPSKEVLGEALGTKIEDMLWRWIVKEKDMESLARSPNKLANQKLLVEVLGALAGIRFLTVTDRFVVELGKGFGTSLVGGANSKSEKEAEGKFELIVRAMRSFKLRVYPPQDFDMGADLLGDVAGFFSQTHGTVLKIAYAETLLELIHPIANVATAEVNHPTWAKAINTIHVQAVRMASKDKYWAISFPLVVTTLCVSPREAFMEQWQGCLASAIGKMKDRMARPVIINSILRLLWVYLNRCSGESSSIVTKSLDSVFRFCFPPSNQPTIQPAEVPIDVFVYLLHFTLLRQFDYGQELTLQLLAANRLTDGGKMGSEIQTPERMAIAIRAILLYLHCLEHDVKTPSFPSISNFSSFAYSADYEFSGEVLPEAVLAKPGVTNFMDRVCPLVGTIAVLAARDVGQMSLFEDRFHLSRSHPPDSSDNITVKHGLLRLSYRRVLKPTFELFRAVLDSWPRCGHPSVDINRMMDIICGGIAHVDPDVAAAATSALKRIARAKGKAEVAVVALAKFLSSTDKVVRANQVGFKAYEQQVERLVHIWVETLTLWTDDVRDTPEEDRIPVGAHTLAEIECSALFFLSSSSRSLRTLAISALRKISEIQDLSMLSGQPTLRVIIVLENEGQDYDIPTTISSISSTQALSDQARLSTFTNPTPPDILIKWAESENSTDQQLWFAYYPYLIKHLHEKVPVSLLILRTLVGRVFLNWRSTISAINGQAKSNLATAPNSGFRSNLPLSTKGVSDHFHLAEQWKIFLTILCATTLSGDESTSIGSSAIDSPVSRDVEAERLATSKVLFQQVISFLGSENHRFRDAAVVALGHIPQPSLADLLGSLQSVTRHVYDNAQPNSRSTPARRVSESENSSRTYTSVAHVFARISHLIKDPRSLGDVKLMLAMLEFVRRTHRYLAIREDDWNLHPLRRYFCGVVENLTDGLATLDDSSRFFPSELRASVFKICDEWCNLGRRADIVQARESRVLVAIHGSLTSDDRDKGAILSTMSNEAKLLSSAAATAMAALCQGSLFPSLETSDLSRSHGEITLELTNILQWIRGLFSAPSTLSHEVGRKALRSLIQHNHEEPSIMVEVLHQCCSEGDQFELPRSFFSVLVDTMSFSRPPVLSFSQKACVALIKLGHPDVAIRRRAYDLVETLGNKDEFEFAWIQPSVGSSAPNVYMGAQRRIAEALADSHPTEASFMLSEYTLRLSRVDSLRRPVCLAICPPFLKHLDLAASDASTDPDSIPTDVLLSNLLFLSVKFEASHSNEVRDIWINLACGPFPQNRSCIIKFLFQQASRRNSLEFIIQAQRIVAYLAQTPIAQAVYEDLSSFIEPAAMVSFPEVEESWCSKTNPNIFLPDLNALFPAASSTSSLSTGQLALLFVGEVMLERVKESSLDPRLAVLLHATCTQVDHQSTQVREQAQGLLFQILYAWTCDSVHLEDENDWVVARDEIGRLWQDRSKLFWSHDDGDPLDESLHAPKRMKTLVERVLDVLEPFYPELRHVWGALAVDWGTSCPNRHLACRSFQIFRILSPEVSAQMLADMLGRLSNTLADTLPRNNLFCREIILSLSEIVRSMGTEDLLSFPQLFWCASACLSTTVEGEFLVSMELLDLVLAKLDLCEDETVDILLQNQPDDWPGDDLKLQAVLLPGLRSSLTDQATFNTLSRLAKTHCPLLLDMDADRTLHMFTAVLPWCLHGMDQDTLDPSLIDLAEDITSIAEREGKLSIQRLMTSFSKSRFRTKDDFLRQAVGCLREHFLPSNGFRVIEVLLGFCLNSRDWMREKTMLILKLVFQSPEAKDPLSIYGAELLMPLLRLLNTDFAASALEVLSEPINIQGGPAAAQVIRMSMTFGAVMDGLTDSAGEVFGTPLESGWCVAKAEEQSRLARASMLAVFDSLTVSGNVQSQAHFSMFAEPAPFGINGSQLSLESYAGSIAEELTLGQLVGDLHSLNQFFDDEPEDDFPV